MDYNIVEKPSFNIVGKSIRVQTKDGQNFESIPKFWQDSNQNGTVHKIATLASADGVVEGAILGICTDFAPDMSEFTYMIAAEGHETPDGMVTQTIPSTTWAIFKAKGPMPEAIQNLWGYVWSEFFPNAPYTHGTAPDLEIYPKGDVTDENYLSEVWVPVVPK